MHEGGEVLGAPYGGRAGMERVIAENAADMEAFGDRWPRARLNALIAAQRECLDRNAALLDSRRDHGFVRRCHGDLHLGNVVLWQDRPTIFDCIEFSDDIAVIDVAYDLAFLLMDLDVRRLRPFANRALSRYLGRLGGIEILAALPLMLSLRASVRCKVAAMAISGLTDSTEAAKRLQESEAFLEGAERFLAIAPAPCLVAVGGLSGTGKTTLAMGLAPLLGRAPGAIVLRSDVIRKRLAKVLPEQRLPEEAYTPERSREVYETLLREASAALNAGQSVIVDAVFALDQERQAVETISTDRAVHFFGIWLDCSGSLLKQRVVGRTGDASDATPEVVDRQSTMTLGLMAWRRLDASGRPETSSPKHWPDCRGNSFAEADLPHGRLAIASELEQLGQGWVAAITATRRL